MALGWTVPGTFLFAFSGIVWVNALLTWKDYYGHRRSQIKCNVPMDMVFALDSSGSIGLDNWHREIDYVERLLKLLEISSRGTRVGLVDFSTFAKARLSLKKGYSAQTVFADLHDAREQYKGDLTSTERALERAVDMFKESGLGRNAPRILIVVTDGKTTWKNGKNDKTSNPSTAGKQLLGKPVANLKTMNVTVYAVGVGQYINLDELMFITQDFSGSRVIKIRRFNDLVLSINSILQPYCGEPPTQVPPMTTVSPPEECEIKLRRLGCYYDSQRDPRPLPDYILNDRDPTLPGFSGKKVDWKNWNTYFPDFICRCAKKAHSMGRKIIGLQFYGECYTSSDVTTYNKDGPRNEEKDCLTFFFKPCKEDSTYCVGAQYHNFVYTILGVAAT